MLNSAFRALQGGEHAGSALSPVTACTNAFSCGPSPTSRCRSSFDSPSARISLTCSTGYDRAVGRMPVPYPSACSPQAWASGTPLLFLRTMLGLEARDGRLIVDPDIPEELGRIKLLGTNAFGKRWNVDAIGSDADVRPAA